MRLFRKASNYQIDALFRKLRLQTLYFRWESESESRRIVAFWGFGVVWGTLGPARCGILSLYAHRVLAPTSNPEEFHTVPLQRFSRIITSSLLFIIENLLVTLLGVLVIRNRNVLT